ncbi:MAG TPA: hypothetical protein PKH77_00830 [Anaerolineae bacterium]|nr:hypothetical protein [Anaerolineae bacterium]
MLHKKFNTIAQFVGYVTIGLLALYGLATLVGDGTVWAVLGQSAPPPAAPQAADALAPTTLGYVGYLKDDAGAPLNDVYTMTFRIYASAAITTPLWEETQPNVSVSGGVFNVVLGAGAPFSATLFADPDRYLGITVEGYGGELTPRQQFASVPYSLRSDRAGGLAAADGDPADAVVVDNAGNATFGGDVTVLGSMGDVAMSSATVSGHATMDSAAVSGSAIISDRVGIGTTSPTAELDVRGSRIQLKEDSSGDAITLGTWGDALDINFNDHLFLQGSGGSQIYLNPNGGDVGVGTNAPQATLHVSGTATVNGNITTTGDIHWDRNQGHLTGLKLTTEYEVISNESGTQSVQMVSSSNSMCFLTHVWFEDTEDDGEYAQCEIGTSGGYWVLYAHAVGTGFFDPYAYCQARCLQW